MTEDPGKGQKKSRQKECHKNITLCMSKIQDRSPEKLCFVDIDQDSGISTVFVNKRLFFHTIFFRYWIFIIFLENPPLKRKDLVV